MSKKMIELIKKYYDKETTSKIINGYKKDRFTTIRINTLKTNIDYITKYFDGLNIQYEKVSWYECALIIKNKKEDFFKGLDIYKNGLIYFQSLSSMLPPLFMDLRENEQILDMTAAPGSKTSEIASLCNNNIMITALEKNSLRFDRLNYNLNKLGVKKVTTLKTDALNLDDYFIFDNILLDAPCSGSGTLTINDIDSFNISLVDKSVKIQEKLLDKAINHLRSGSTLLYSTCSIIKCENEEIVNKILNKYSNLEIVPLDLSKYKDLPKLPVTINGSLCLYPNEFYEGFFIIKIKKN